MASEGYSRVASANGASENRDRLCEVAERYQEEFPWVDVDAIEVTLSMLRMGRLIGAATRRHFDSINLGDGITDARFTLLVTLYFTKDRRLAQNQISRELGVSRTNITNLIDGLERDGLVRRVANPTDRRVSHAQLTQAGEELCGVMLPVATRFMEEMTSNFSSSEKRQLRDYLRRFRQDVRARYLPPTSGEPADTDAQD